MTKLSKESFTIKLGYFCDTKYPMSRSEARRIVKSVNSFEEIILDFEEIDNIGQAFCHEIFVVFQNVNPSIKINYIHASDEVKGMISRILNTAKILNKNSN